MIGLIIANMGSKSNSLPLPVRRWSLAAVNHRVLCQSRSPLITVVSVRAVMVADDVADGVAEASGAAGVECGGWLVLAGRIRPDGSTPGPAQPDSPAAATAAPSTARRESAPEGRSGVIAGAHHR